MPTRVPSPLAPIRLFPRAFISFFSLAPRSTSHSPSVLLLLLWFSLRAKTKLTPITSQPPSKLRSRGECSPSRAEELNSASPPSARVRRCRRGCERREGEQRGPSSVGCSAGNAQRWFRFRFPRRALRQHVMLAGCRRMLTQHPSYSDYYNIILRARMPERGRATGDGRGMHSAHQSPEANWLKYFRVIYL